MIKIAVFGNSHRADQKDLLIPLFKKLDRDDVMIYLEKKFAKAIGEGFAFPDNHKLLETNEIAEMSFVISLGGDGTFLRTVRATGEAELPILGINLGRLGFLTELDCNDAVEQIDHILSGNYEIEERTQLQVFAGMNLIGDALNEVAIQKRETGSMIRIKAYVGNDFLADYDGDGLIIATPSGSTAYSLSVNGPIVMPDCPSIIINPIAPHTLNMRPLVVSDQHHIQLQVESRNHTYLVALDGKIESFDCDVPLSVRRSPHKVKMIRLGKRSWPEVLRRKLMWGASVR